MSEEASGLDKLGVPIVLLSATWGGFDVVLKSIEMQNHYRDTVTSLANRVTPEEWMTIFWSDWLPLWIGTTLFLFIFTIVIWQIPGILRPTSHGYALQKRLCRIATALPAFAFCGSFIGGIVDIRVFWDARHVILSNV